MKNWILFSSVVLLILGCTETINSRGQQNKPTYNANGTGYGGKTYVDYADTRCEDGSMVEGRLRIESADKGFFDRQNCQATPPIPVNLNDPSVQHIESGDTDKYIIGGVEYFYTDEPEDLTNQPARLPGPSPSPSPAPAQQPEGPSPRTGNISFVHGGGQALCDQTLSEYGYAPACSLGGGCCASGEAPSTGCTSANPGLYGACVKQTHPRSIWMYLSNGSPYTGTTCPSDDPTFRGCFGRQGQTCMARGADIDVNGIPVASYNIFQCTQID